MNTITAQENAQRGAAAMRAYSAAGGRQMPSVGELAKALGKGQDEAMGAFIERTRWLLEAITNSTGHPYRDAVFAMCSGAPWLPSETQQPTATTEKTSTMIGISNGVSNTLTPEQRQVCAALGIAPEAYAQTLSTSDMDRAIAGLLDDNEKAVCAGLGIPESAYLAEKRRAALG